MLYQDLNAILDVGKRIAEALEELARQGIYYIEKEVEE